MFCPQIGKGDIAPNFTIQDKINAPCGQQLCPPQHHVFFQLKPGNTINQQTPDTVITIINSDLVAFAAQHICGRQTSRTRANYSCRQAIFLCHLNWFNPAFFERGFCDMLFHRTDSDRFKTFFDHTIAFTQPVLRTDAPANFRKSIGR